MHFEARKIVHNRKFGVEHDFEILEEHVSTKSKLDFSEETKIRQYGGPQSKGGTLANKRSQMSESRYKEAENLFNSR